MFPTGRPRWSRCRKCHFCTWCSRCRKHEFSAKTVDRYIRLYPHYHYPWFFYFQIAKVCHDLLCDIFPLQTMSLKDLRTSQNMSRAWDVAEWSAPTTASCMATWIPRSSYLSFQKKVSSMKKIWWLLSLSIRSLQRMSTSFEPYCGMIDHPMGCWNAVTPWKQLLDRSILEGSYWKVHLKLVALSFTTLLLFRSIAHLQFTVMSFHRLQAPITSACTQSKWSHCSPLQPVWNLWTVPTAAARSDGPSWTLSQCPS